MNHLMRRSRMGFVHVVKEGPLDVCDENCQLCNSQHEVDHLTGWCYLIPLTSLDFGYYMSELLNKLTRDILGNWNKA